MRKCPQCRKFNDDSNQCCIYCGTALSREVAEYWQTYPPDAWYCLSCGSVGYPKKLWKGTFVMEALLLILSVLVASFVPVIGFFIFLGFICYGIWRIVTRKTGCIQCKQTNLIPVTSPIAVKMLRR